MVVTPRPGTVTEFIVSVLIFALAVVLLTLARAAS